MKKESGQNDKWEDLKTVVKENMPSLRTCLVPDSPWKGYWDFHLIGVRKKGIPGGLQFNKSKGLCFSFTVDGKDASFQKKVKDGICSRQPKNTDFRLEFILPVKDKKDIYGKLQIIPLCNDTVSSQWYVDKAVELAGYLEKIRQELEKEKVEPRWFTKKNEDETSRLHDETTKLVRRGKKGGSKVEGAGVRYPLTIKVDLEPFKSPEYNLPKLSSFGDIQCRYESKVENGEVFCFVLRECPECSEQEIIIGLRKDLLQGSTGEAFFQLNGEDESWHRVSEGKDAKCVLPLTYGMTSSWAVGPKAKDGTPAKAKEGNYYKILHDWLCGEFSATVVRDDTNKKVEYKDCLPATMDSFHPSMVLLGQNWSKRIWEVCEKDMENLRNAYWQNFQPGNAAEGRGGLLRDSLEGTIFEKAYMTDLEKGNICTDSGRARRNSNSNKLNNQNILFNELQDLRAKMGKEKEHLVIGVWGTGVWNELSREMKAEKGKWENCEFRLIGSHYANGRNLNEKEVRHCISDFTASMTWARVLYEHILNEHIAIKGKNNDSFLRHLCYIAGVNIHNELYRKSENECGFGAKGTNQCKGDEAVKFLEGETWKQAGQELCDFHARLVSEVMQKLADDIKATFNASESARGKRAYDVLIRNDISHPKVLEFIEEFIDGIVALICSVLREEGCNHELERTN